ncbi:P44/Msp2 family outer membrane protein [Ehrlichia canis]|uniref:Surface antigen msp4 n=2 Tax=Ehrlichia canis TaxID=944 RepID=A0ACA6AXD1_EHRCJ|nr:P44/Msp2 family outer membrane protein [Ehrlichia canis]AAK28689.1 major outer membrane protein P30-12 [Ehrlichia canis]AAZ68935.1 Surface antigen msp4 [Ehrlichia canis str. Jake]
MNSKKTFSILGSILICLAACLPIQSFSESSNVTYNTKHTGLYISGLYKPSVSHFSDFSIKETYTNTEALFGLKQDISSILRNKETTQYNNNFNVPYTAKFQDDFASFSIAVGYIANNGPRIEIEGSYEEFDVKNPGNYTTIDAHRYIALAREKTSYYLSSPKENKYVIIKNNGISIVSIIINGCYDISLNDSKVSPYICTGFGGDFIEFFSAIRFKFAYQGKIGISYSLSSNIILFTDGYYHKVINSQFKNLNVEHVVNELTTDPKVTSATAFLNIEYFGGEFGLKFIF